MKIDVKAQLLLLFTFNAPLLVAQINELNNGIVAYNRGDFTTAYNNFQAGLSISHGHRKMQSNMCYWNAKTVYQKGENYTVLNDLITIAIDLDPKNTYALYLKAQIDRASEGK